MGDRAAGPGGLDGRGCRGAQGHPRGDGVRDREWLVGQRQEGGRGSGGASGRSEGVCIVSHLPPGDRHPRGAAGDGDRAGAAHRGQPVRAAAPARALEDKERLRRPGTGRATGLSSRPRGGTVTAGERGPQCGSLLGLIDAATGSPTPLVAAPSGPTWPPRSHPRSQCGGAGAWGPRGTTSSPGGDRPPPIPRHQLELVEGSRPPCGGAADLRPGARG